MKEIKLWIFKGILDTKNGGFLWLKIEYNKMRNMNGIGINCTMQFESRRLLQNVSKW